MYDCGSDQHHMAPPEKMNSAKRSPYLVKHQALKPNNNHRLYTLKTVNQSEDILISNPQLLQSLIQEIKHRFNKTLTMNLLDQL